MSQDDRSPIMRFGEVLQKRFVIFLFSAVALGFVVPGLESTPPPVIVFFLALLIFVSAFRITLGEVRSISPRQPVIFYLLRYPLLAVVLWGVAQLFFPAVATGVLLLTLAPAGVASPGVTGMYRGNVSLSIVIVVISSFLAPFLIPLQLQLFVARHVEVQTFAIFQTLLVCVFIPIVLHIPLRTYRIAEKIRANDSVVVVPTIATLVMLVIAGQKAFIRAHAVEALGFIAITIVLFFGYYAFGWWVFPANPRRERITFALGSGVNNTAIVIVLSYLYFSHEVSTFLVTSELAWVGSMATFKYVLHRTEKIAVG